MFSSAQESSSPTTLSLSNRNPSSSLRRTGESVCSALLAIVKILEPLSKEVPHLEAAVGVVLKIAEAVKAAKHNKEECYRLGEKIQRILTAALDSFLKHGVYYMDASMYEPIDSLARELTAIHGHILTLSNKGMLKRFLSAAEDKDILADLEKSVNDVVQLLLVKTQVTTGMDVEYLRNENVRRLVADMRHPGGWQESRRSLPGTRTSYLNEIDAWSRNPDSPSVLWLTGIAGAGKSTIATEVAARLHEQKAIYSCFFFDRHADTALSVIQVLAFGLSFSPGLRLPITGAFENTSDPRAALSLQQQLHALVVSPLVERLSAPAFRDKPVVLIMDGLDECRRDLCTDLLRGIHLAQIRLPPNVKFFLTSRPQSDIAMAMETISASHLAIDVSGYGEEGDDARAFIEAELGRIRKAKNLSGEWSEKQLARDVAALSERAAGLFQWAKVVCTLLNDSFSPCSVISRILRLVPETEPEANLDGLYLEALRIALPRASRDPELQVAYKTVVGFIISAPDPPEILLICNLFDMAEERVRRLLTDLGCVVRVGWMGELTIAHASFSDFITDATRCSDLTFYIDPVLANQRMDDAYNALLPQLPWCKLTDLQLSEEFLNVIAPSFSVDVYPDPLACLRDNCVYVLPLMLASILFNEDVPSFLTDAGLSRLDALSVEKFYYKAHKSVRVFLSCFHLEVDWNWNLLQNIYSACLLSSDTKQWPLPLRPLPPSAIWTKYTLHNWRALKKEHPSWRPNEELRRYLEDLRYGTAAPRSLDGPEGAALED
ncbi:hypothetical protein BV25DRAFT_1367527 [Artomyces pyxidatus]|uniref:Uncharacterized protein n=1 Tax=Artomyces pyxidatus TaxID=48021 RepID=A0ACB8SLW8_9AGAM|nr:hypothetical protein BV25DRAFT_1367527 [Artomyces pyxidatus]